MGLYFIDLEFIERGHKHSIDLISVGIVDESDHSYYAISTEFSYTFASQWVRDNVLAKLPPRYAVPIASGGSPRVWEESQAWKSREQIKADILEFVGIGRPKFVGEWPSYDWVCFAQIFGTMMDLPQGYPMRPFDIIQWSEDHLGIPSEELPPSLETEGNHNALLGALTVKMRYEWLKAKEQELRGT